MNKYSQHSVVLVLFAAAMALVGCAQPFPPETLSKVNRSVTFPELQKNPEQHNGTWLMLGGVIVASRNTKEGTFIEVLQRPLDSDGQPLQTDETAGRFLARSDQFLDTAVYHQGRLITVIGEVAGKRIQPLDEVQYQYPLLIVKDLHLWNPYTGPRFYFGVGVSGRM